MTVEAFMKSFEALPDQLTTFTVDSWLALTNYITVYSADDIRVTFRNHQEIQA